MSCSETYLQIVIVVAGFLTTALLGKDKIMRILEALEKLLEFSSVCTAIKINKQQQSEKINTQEVSASSLDKNIKLLK